MAGCYCERGKGASRMGGEEVKLGVGDGKGCEVLGMGRKGLRVLCEK